MAQLNCVRLYDSGDIYPTVHHDPPACHFGARNELPRQFQTPDRRNGARPEVHGHRAATGLQQGGYPAERIDSTELAVRTDDVEPWNDY